MLEPPGIKLQAQQSKFKMLATICESLYEYSPTPQTNKQTKPTTYKKSFIMRDWLT